MNDVPRSFRGNSNAARDIAHHLHPYTNFKKHEETGPLTIVRGRGIYVTTTTARNTSRAWPACGRRRWASATSGLATVAYEQMKQLPFYHAFNQRSHEPAINLAEKLKQMAPVEMSKVFFANSGLRGQRHRRQDGVVHEQCAGPPKKKKIVSRSRAITASPWRRAA
jgi:4-aminobutyrate--pyruvate transaminase